jgi:hypothetical protein
MQKGFTLVPLPPQTKALSGFSLGGNSPSFLYFFPLSYGPVALNWGLGGLMQGFNLQLNQYT